MLAYQIILEKQIYYNHKAAYIFLVEESFNHNAAEDGVRLFVWEFFMIFKKNNKALKILEKEILKQGIERVVTFDINPKLTEFSALINRITNLFEFLIFEDEYGITSEQFRDLIKKIFFKLQKFLED